MTRVINLSLAEADVIARCQKAGVTISAIEPLAEAGSHLVCLTGEGAETMRGLLAGFILPGKPKRLPFYVPPSRQVR